MFENLSVMQGKRNIMTSAKARVLHVVFCSLPFTSAHFRAGRVADYSSLVRGGLALSTDYTIFFTVGLLLGIFISQS